MADPDGGAWNDVLAHLRKHAPSLYRRWFEDLAVAGLDGLIASIAAPSESQREYLESRCADAFDDALRSVTGTLITARFRGPAASVPRRDRDQAPTGEDEIRALEAERGGRLELRPPVEHEPRNASRDFRHGTLPLLPDCSFEHFVVGPGNRLAHAAARAVADRPGRAYNPFFVHGGVGLGKSHLLQAICLELIETRPGLRIFYTCCEDFTSRFIESVKAGKMSEFHKQFRDVDALVIDDIHFLASRERTQEEFFHTFNALYQADKQIILSSDAPPEEIPDLEARLLSRFKWGLVAEVEAPSFETRIEIIKEKCRLWGMELDQGVAEFIAAREQTNIRELEGDLNTLQACALTEEAPVVTLEIARGGLGERIAPHAAATPITVEQVIRQVTEYFGVRPADLFGRKRARSVTFPRQLGMYLTREHTRHSLEEIGGFFGGRDHTTVMHALKRIADAVKSNEQARSALIALEQRLGVARPSGQSRAPGRDTDQLRRDGTEGHELRESPERAAQRDDTRR